mgnify:CR=1 FL=1
MKIKYFKEDDILNVSFSNNPVDFAEESDWIIVNFDTQKNPVSIEILDATRFFSAQSKALPTDVKEKFFASFA